MASNNGMHTKAGFSPAVPFKVDETDVPRATPSTGLGEGGDYSGPPTGPDAFPASAGDVVGPGAENQLALDTPNYEHPDLKSKLMDLLANLQSGAANHIPELAGGGALAALLGGGAYLHHRHNKNKEPKMASAPQITAEDYNEAGQVVDLYAYTPALFEKVAEYIEIPNTAEEVSAIVSLAQRLRGIEQTHFKAAATAQSGILKAAGIRSQAPAQPQQRQDEKAWNHVNAMLGTPGIKEASLLYYDALSRISAGAA